MSTAAGPSRIAGPSSGVSDGSTPGDRGFKRKFEDALYNLDKAVEPAVPQPAKKSKLTHSVYSTLAKYGIKKDPRPQTSTAPTRSRLESLSKTAPHLVFLLNRGASRKRKHIPFKLTQTTPLSVISAPPVASEYRPSSTSSFLSRLSTFKLTTYANKPAAIDAVAAAKCGWVNEGKDRLVCGICSVSWVIANKDGMSRETAATLVEKQRISLVQMHKDGCPWKSKQCEDSIYCVPLQTPSVMSRELRSRALKLDLVLMDVQIKHPLSATQVQALLTALHSAVQNDNITAEDRVGSSLNISMDVDPSGEASETAVLTAMFGWTVVLPTSPSASTQHTSVSRSSSLAPSNLSTPRRPRTDAVYSSASRDSTPVPGSSGFPSLQREPSTLSVASASPSALIRVKPDATLLFCPLCQRRIGLWAFIPPPRANTAPTAPPSSPSLAGGTTSQPRRQLDVLKEHRSYCPYVVKSTVLPSFPIPPMTPTSRPQTPSREEPYSLGANLSLSQVGGQAGVEGWRAVMSMVLRYGAVHKRRLRRFHSATAHSSAPSDLRPDVPTEEFLPELDQVDQMVEGVKARGGRDLLRYVKGLLG